MTVGLFGLLSAVVTEFVGVSPPPATYSTINLVTAAHSPYASTSGFYVNPNTQASQWVNSNPNDYRTPSIRSSIASRAVFLWVGPGDVTSYVNNYVTAATNAGELPQLVAYAIPNRDCGGFASGGEPNTSAYLAWAQRFGQAVGDRSAIVILEPDATMLCWNSDKVTQLRGAINAINQYAPKTWIYIDAGDGRWHSSSEIAPRIQRVGMQGVRGVSLNVSNYNTEATVRTFMTGFYQLIGSQIPFIYDTSRNGKGPDAAGNWCNIAGRRIGLAPQFGGTDGLDAVVWVKPPGESDGNCGAYPNVPGGQFSPEIAINSGILGQGPVDAASTGAATARQAIRRGSLTSVKDLIPAIRRFVDDWNDAAAP